MLRPGFRQVDHAAGPNAQNGQEVRGNRGMAEEHGYHGDSAAGLNFADQSEKPASGLCRNPEGNL